MSQSSQQKEINYGGNKKVHEGPKGGLYIIVQCKGKKVKRYITNKNK